MDFVRANINDVLVASHSMEEHKNHLKIIFKRFEKYGIVMNTIKCTFSISSSPIKNKGKIQFPVPTNMKNLQKFLVMAKCYCRFIVKCVSILTKLLTNNKKCDIEV